MKNQDVYFLFCQMVNKDVFFYIKQWYQSFNYLYFFYISVG